eukprot:TRINITY_DN21570_c0_g1_i1.p1 TRINITY_DN21570_c0_g1~~TRINITY_DN21570_c0_g1_i1.p1  ORF type:complete len:118 (-),score=28.01 TRINITY_DN21570_c0_g1_i1:208-561(-)
MLSTWGTDTTEAPLGFIFIAPNRSTPVWVKTLREKNQTLLGSMGSTENPKKFELPVKASSSLNEENASINSSFWQGSHYGENKPEIFRQTLRLLSSKVLSNNILALFNEVCWLDGKV